MPKTASSLPDEWRLIPGYDPVATAPPGCWFDLAAAARACAFFEECLTFTCGEKMGQPFRLEPWQASIVANAFGWKRPDKLRRYRTVFVYVPRKNGKTELAAGIGNLLAFADNEPGAQVYAAAADREQARLVFTAASTMVANEPALGRRARVYTNSIAIFGSRSFFKVVSAEAYTKHGLNVHGVIIDELHAHPNRELYDVLTTGTGSRRQPLVVIITTADYDREGSICNDTYRYACKVRDGVGQPDPTFLPVIYELAKEDDWTDIDVLAKANPNLGVSLRRDYLEQEIVKAKETPSYTNTMKRLHANIITEQAEVWIPLDAWDALPRTRRLEDFKGAACYAALDLSSTTDLTALCLLFVDGSVFYPFVWAWVPRENAIVRSNRDRAPYLEWADAGVITLTPGKVIDYKYVRQTILELADSHRILDIAIDRWNATQLATELMDDGFEVVAYGQGYRDMSPAAKEFETRVMAGDMERTGDPLLRWALSHCAIVRDEADNIKPSKKHSTDRIDPIVATVMAIGRAIVQGDGRSVYEERGIIAL